MFRISVKCLEGVTLGGGHAPAPHSLRKATKSAGALSCDLMEGTTESRDSGRLLLRASHARTNM